MSSNTNGNPSVVIEDVIEDIIEDVIEDIIEDGNDEVTTYTSDNDSFLTDEDDFDESFDDEFIDAIEEENVTDQIINAFTVKRRKAMIDQDDHEQDNVDYETSVQRLFKLAIVLALAMAMISTALLIKHRSQGPILILYPETHQESPRQMYPHLALLFNNGNIEIFEFLWNSKLNHSWSLRIPQGWKSHFDGVKSEEYETFGKFGHLFYYSEYQSMGHFFNFFGYISVITNGNLMVFYPEGKNDTTVVFNNGMENLTHYIIKNSKLPQKLLYDPRFVQVGHTFWMFGGLTSKYDCQQLSSIKHCSIDYIKNRISQNTVIWNLERQMYYEGPKLPDNALVKGCPIALNR